MKVLHIATTPQGGAGIGMRRYHEALLSVGCDSRMLVAEGTGGPSGASVDTVRRRYARGWDRIARAAGISSPPEVSMAKRVAEADADATDTNYELFSLPYSSYPVEDHPWVVEADVVCLHFVAGFLDWPRFFRKVRKPVVVFLHDQQPYLGGFHYERDAERNPQLRALEDEVRRIKQSALGDQCVGVVANSAWNAEAARRSGFFQAGVPIETIYYPMDTTVFQPRPREAAKQAFGIDPAKQVIGFACENLDNDRKGFAQLLGALGFLPEQLQHDVVLLSFGREPSDSMRDRVKIPWLHLGSLSSPAAQVAAYSAIDTFVVPSKAEAFGLTAQEALACGCRVVATRVGGLLEALGEHGCYAESCDPSSIAEALNTALTANEKNPNAETWLENQFGEKVTGLQLEAFLSSVADGKKGPDFPR
jgi:glycosyltransferase involved in cell wall biosynthesis